MPYKPKFCCQCGEKIDNIDRKPWTSRRFCELCATEFGIHDKIRGAAMGIALLLGLYGIGTYFQKPEKPLNVASAQFVQSNRKVETPPTKTNAQAAPGETVQTATQSNNFNAPTTARIAPAAENLKIRQPTVPTAEPAEKVYFCGAATKKGTMCSRRVKNGGRCWQHEGQPALLPQEKLLAVQSN